MRYARIARLIMRMFLLLLASTMSLVSFLGGYSALLILGDEDNIDLGVNVEGDYLKINGTTPFELQIKFEFKNKGYFDLEDLEIEIELAMVYRNLNFTGVNDSAIVEVLLYEGTKEFKTVKNGDTLDGEISIEQADLKLTVAQVLFIVENIDRKRTPMVEFIAPLVKISGKYSLGLISFNVEIEDLDIEGYDIT